MTKDIFKDFFRYDSISGLLIRTVDVGIHKSDAVVGSKDHDGYLLVGFRKKKYKVHRICWLLHYGDWPKNQIDHVNGDPSDNRIINLRDVTPSENNRNQKISRANNSGVIGVCWNKKQKRWIAFIKLHRQQIYLGSFCEKATAVTARKRAEAKYGFHKNHGRNVIMQQEA